MAWRLCVPRHFPLRNVEPFVQQKRPWIERTLLRMRESEADFPPARVYDGGEVPYLGERLSLAVRTERSRTRAHVSRRGFELRVKLGPENALHDALEAWYRRQARLEVAPRLDAAVAHAGRSYDTLQIRGQRTRWASCSTSGAMSFNWRLLLAPGRDPRLRRRARGGAPRRTGPLVALLAPPGLTLPGLARARGVAAPPRALPAPTPSGRSARPGIARRPPRRPRRARRWPCRRPRRRSPRTGRRSGSSTGAPRRWP